MNLFAYGTLMSVEGLRDALGERADVVTMRPARLPGWRRIWNVFRSEWNGGVLNLEPSPNDVVVGMLVEGLVEDDLQLLDSRNSTHPPATDVYVEPFTGEVVPAQVYRRRKGNHGGKPSGRYKMVVLERAYRAGWRGLREPLPRHRRLCRQPLDVRLIPRPRSGFSIKVMMLPKDTNALGTIFGGVIASHIDLAAAVEARKAASHRYVLKVMREVEFHEPVFVGDIVSFLTETARIGRSLDHGTRARRGRALGQRPRRAREGDRGGSRAGGRGRVGAADPDPARSGRRCSREAR